MKIPNPYFQNVPKYGDFCVEQVIVAYVYPLLSVLKDNAGNRYLCMCFDTRGTQQWLISPISPANLVKLLTNQLTLKEAFIKDADTVIYAFRNYETKADSFVQMTPQQVPTDYLPEAGEYLDAEPDEWEAYIQQINASTCGWIESLAAAPIFSSTENCGIRIFVKVPKRYSALTQYSSRYRGAVSALQRICCGVYPSEVEV